LTLNSPSTQNSVTVLSNSTRNWKQELSVKKDLGEQIRRARTDCGLTQTELAHEIGVSRQMIARYEAGKAMPSIDVLARAAIILDVDFDVDGIHAHFEQTDSRSKLRSVPHQLRLDFGRSHTYSGATIEITPRKGRLLISASIPA
jgi:transcriptional regulator with XRE-family HTH domain